MQIRTSTKAFLSSFTSLTLVILETWLLNVYARPIGMDVNSGASTIVYIVAIGIDALFAFIAFFLHAQVDVRVIQRVAVALLFLGCAIAFDGIVAPSDAALLIGLLVVSAGRNVADLIVLMTLASLKPRSCALCVGSSLVSAGTINALLGLTPRHVGLIACMALPFVYLQIATTRMRHVLPPPGKTSNVPTADLAATEPRAFMPPFHMLFIALFVFRVAFGFSMTFFAHDNMPSQTVLVIVPLAVACIAIISSKKPLFGDTLYYISTLLIVAGFLLSSPAEVGTGNLPYILLVAGSECFRLLGYYFLAQNGQRNPLANLFAVAWGSMAINLGSFIGFLSGERMGALAGDDPGLATLCLSLIVFAFVAFNVVCMHARSFDGALRDVAPLPVHDDARGTSPSSRAEVDAGCDALAAGHGLTPRETDVLLLLARGRSVPYIQEKLSVSHNTVRTHVRHIYQKLDVHSQQELISMVGLLAHSTSVPARRHQP